MRKLTAASVTEIAAVPGVGLRTAHSVYEALHPGHDGQGGAAAPDGQDGPDAADGQGGKTANGGEA